MDPNRNSLETILKLPTHRLLAVYRQERNYSHYNDGDETEQRLSAMKDELCYREHLIRS